MDQPLDFATSLARLAAETAVREHTEQLLGECEERYRLVGLATDDAVWEWNLETGEVIGNQVAVDRIGNRRSPEDRTIVAWQRNIHIDDRDETIETFARAIRGTGYAVSAEHRFRKLDGSFAYVYNRAYIIRDADGRATRVVGAMIDLTELRLVTERLARTEAILVHASRVSAMGTMASMLAHELNQPLSAITNYVRAGRRLAAIDPSLSDEALAAAEENALRAGGIIQRLRELVTQRPIARKPHRLATLIDHACTIALADAERKGVHHTVAIAARAAIVMADRIQLEQVLINLLRNAVEAMPATGPRTITIFARPSGKFVEIGVRDSGDGIACNVRDTMFASVATTKPAGMGIGLSICRTIVESHGGKIWLADGAPGRTEFRFTLPVAPPSVAPAL